MLLGARTAAWSGGKALPYDYKVSWLSGSSNVSFDTGFHPVSGQVWTIDIESYTSGMFGCLDGASKRFHSNAPTSWGTCGLFNAIESISGRKFVVDIPAAKIKVDDNEYTIATSSRPSWQNMLPNSNFYLFSRNYNGTVAFSTMSIRCFELEINGSKVCRLVPVVKDNVGYFYDEVLDNGVLLPPRTGVFGIGPRI